MRHAPGRWLQLASGVLAIGGLWCAAAVRADESKADVVAAEPMLSAHNLVRSRHGLPLLRWSERLAEDAADWADHLAEQESCRMSHSTQGQGENLYWASPVRWSDGRTTLQSVTAGKVVQSWASEQQDYDYLRNRCRGEQCGHYTQIVWEATELLGCAKRTCRDLSQLWVCRYDPPGNIIGQRPY